MTRHEESTDLLTRVIEKSANHPFIVILCVSCFTLWGFLALESTPLDAIPDLSETNARPDGASWQTGILGGIPTPHGTVLKHCLTTAYY